MQAVAYTAMAAGTLFAASAQQKQGQQSLEIAQQNAALANQTALDNEAIARENLAISNREALATERQGLAAVDMKREEIKRLLAYQGAQEGVSGFKYEGTPVDVAKVSAREGEQDVATIWSNALTEAETIRAKGRVAALQGQRSAEQMRAQGDIMVRQGSYAAEAGRTGAMSTLLSGVSNAYMYSKYPQLTASRMKIG